MRAATVQLLATLGVTAVVTAGLVGGVLTSYEETKVDEPRPVIAAVQVRKMHPEKLKLYVDMVLKTNETSNSPALRVLSIDPDQVDVNGQSWRQFLTNKALGVCGELVSGRADSVHKATRLAYPELTEIKAETYTMSQTAADVVCPMGPA